VSIRLLGDPAENDPDFPEDKRRGRTLYLGSRSSEVRVRLYEKGFERRGAGVENIDPNLSRLEVVAAPQKAHKAHAATLSPFEMVGLSKWISDAIQAVVGDHPALIPQNIKRDTTRDERLAQLARQYGRTLREFIDDVGWSRFVETLSIVLYDYDHPKRITPAFTETIQ
jgi:DNA relaxase NicK